MRHDKPNPAERFDAIMDKLWKLDPWIRTTEQNLRTMKNARNTYNAFLKLHGPIRLWKRVG